MSFELSSNQEQGVARVFNAYGQAMMSAQLLERTLAVVSTVLEDDEIGPEAFQEATETAFQQPLGRLIGALDLNPKVSRELSERLRSANRARIRLAHDFFIDSLTALFADPDGLVAQMEVHAEEFGALQKDVASLAMPAVERRGVTAKDLEAFSQVTLHQLSANPGLGAGIDPFRHGEELVRRIAKSIGHGGPDGPEPHND